jgi:hypothetical protein
VALHATSLPFNWKASVEVYMIATFQGATAFPAQIAAASWNFPPRKFDPQGVGYFVRPTLATASAQFYKQASDGDPGYLRRLLLMVDVFMRRPTYDASNGIVAQAEGLIMGGFMNSVGITVKDYSLAGATTLGKFWVRGREPVPVPVEDQWLRARVDVDLEWTEDKDKAA